MKGLICLGLLSICLLNSCAPAPRAPESAPSRPVLTPSPTVEGLPAPKPAKVPLPLERAVATQPYVHEVRWPGETLSLIARWYTGKEHNWREIAKANPGLIPTRISLGDKILILPEMLKTREPMPREYIRSATLPRKAASPQPAESPDGPLGQEMFGPVETLSTPESPGQAELFGPIEP
jgi:hypothetical protein